jgi:hypothetical protein
VDSRNWTGEPEPESRVPLPAPRVWLLLVGLLACACAGVGGAALATGQAWVGGWLGAASAGLLLSGWWGSW